MDREIFENGFPNERFYNSKKKHAEKEKFGLGQRVPKSEENNMTGWLPLSIEQVDTTKPIIICFGGNGTMTSRGANYYAKLVQGWLGIRDAQDYCPVISFYYGGVPNSKTGILNDDELLEISQNLFLPLIQKSGRRLDLTTAQKNMRNLNFFTHCYGATVVNRLVFNCLDLMDELEYTKEEQSAILSQILQVGYAPDNYNYYTTNFFVKSLNDERFGYRYRKEISNVDEFPPYLGQGKLYRDKNNLTLYITSLTGEQTNIQNEHETRYIYRNRQWETRFKRSQGATVCLANAMSSGVVNSKQNQVSKDFLPLISIDELQALDQITLDSYNNDYDERKQKAIYLAQKAEYEEKNKIYKIDELLQANNLTEADILNGKCSLNDVINYRQVDFGNSQLGFVATIPTPRLVDLGAKALSPDEVKHKILHFPPDGIILNNGETMARYSGDPEIIKSDLKMQCDGIDLNDSLRYSAINSTEKDVLNVDYNYGSKENELAKDLQELHTNWQKYDGSVNLPNLDMSYNQTIALLNVLKGLNMNINNLQLRNGIKLNKQAVDESQSQNEIQPTM